MKLTIGFSPCPNDTFIFDALINRKIEFDNIEFVPVLDDVQTLNQWALEGKLDITKLSYGVWPLVKENYQLLDAGSALGKGVGPLLISKYKIDASRVDDCTILIPGKNTTAHLLFSHAFPNAIHKKFVRYDEIEELLLQAEDDKTAGVIIHENRFTYQQKGLQLVSDLGKHWEDETGSPIPLGGIVARKSLGDTIIQKVDNLIKKSIDYSWSTYPELSDYVKVHAQEMNEDVMRKHIDLYVNNYSTSLGTEGNKAIETFNAVYDQMQLRNNF